MTFGETIARMQRLLEDNRVAEAQRLFEQAHALAEEDASKERALPAVLERRRAVLRDMHAALGRAKRTAKDTPPSPAGP